METKQNPTLAEAIAAFRNDIPKRYNAYDHDPAEKCDINELATYIVSVFNALERTLADDKNKK